MLNEVVALVPILFGLLMVKQNLSWPVIAVGLMINGPRMSEAVWHLLLSFMLQMQFTTTSAMSTFERTEVYQRRLNVIRRMGVVKAGMRIKNSMKLLYVYKNVWRKIMMNKLLHLICVGKFKNPWVVQNRTLFDI